MEDDDDDDEVEEDQVHTPGQNMTWSDSAFTPMAGGSKTNRGDVSSSKGVTLTLRDQETVRM